MITIKILLVLTLIQISLSESPAKESHKEKKGKQFRIISGRLADISEFPYQVSIEYHLLQWCGGSIISRTAILTAAHCIDSVKNKTNPPKNFMLVRVGSSQSLKDGKSYSIKRFISHEKFGESSQTDDYDIAFIVLAEQIEFSRNVQPIGLVNKEPIPGEMGWVTGYGRQEPMRRAAKVRHLMAVEIPIMDRDKCRKIHQNYGNIVTDKMICAGFDSGSMDSCKGDSGGPLAVDDKLAGIVAWGLGCGRNGMPGVYTSIAKYRYWIDPILNSISQEEEI